MALRTDMPPIIQDEMRKRSIVKKATTFARFQTRYFMLYKDRLVYRSKDGSEEKGSVSVLGIKICEDVEFDGFGRHNIFQVGFLEKGKMFYLYIEAKDKAMKDKWKNHIRNLCCTYNDQRMQEIYHKGHWKKKTWTCCQKDDPSDVGCSRAFNYKNSAAKGPFNPNPRSHRKTPVLSNRHTRISMPSECYEDYTDIDDDIPSTSMRANSIDQDIGYCIDNHRLSICEPTYEKSAQAMTMKNRSSITGDYDLLRHRHTVADIRSAGLFSSLGESAADGCTATKKTSKLERSVTSYSFRFGSLDSTKPANMRGVSTPNMNRDNDTDRLYMVTSESSSAILNSLNSSRLNSVGSSEASSSIPRTESDYQSRVEETDLTSSSFGKSRSYVDVPPRITKVTEEAASWRTVTRLESGSYANICSTSPCQTPVKRVRGDSEGDHDTINKFNELTLSREDIATD